MSYIVTYYNSNEKQCKGTITITATTQNDLYYNNNSKKSKKRSTLKWVNNITTYNKIKTEQPQNELILQCSTMKSKIGYHYNNNNKTPKWTNIIMYNNEK